MGCNSSATAPWTDPWDHWRVPWRLMAGSQLVLGLELPLDAAGALTLYGRLSWPGPAGLRRPALSYQRCQTV